MKETRPVLIIGAGPTGLTAAVELSRFGVPVRIVDKYTQPEGTSRAVAVQSRTIELMHQRGLADEMLRIGNRGFRTTLFAEGKQLGQVDLSQIDSRFNYVLLLGQNETERILREQVERLGVTIEKQTELVGFSQTEGSKSGVRVTLQRSGGTLEEVEAAYLIDAEGAHSTVRRSMNLSFKGRSLPNTYALADLYIDGNIPENQLTIFVPPTGLLAAFPMGNRRFRIIATEKDGAERAATPPSLEYVQARWDQGSHVPATMRDLKWSSRFRINSRALEKLRHGKVFFGGDSAHIHSPAGGQGMNTGIQDMINLSWKLAMVYRGEATDALLDTYEEERLPIIRELLSTTERGTDLVNSNSQVVHALIQHLMPLVLSLKAIRSKGGRLISEVAANYRESPLSGNSKTKRSLKAGDRFPDVPLKSGSEARSLDVLDPSRFTLLIQNAAAEISGYPFATYAHLISTRSFQAFEAVGLGDASMAVVRPDGYLLCAGNEEHLSQEFDQWLRQWMFQNL